MKKSIGYIAGILIAALCFWAASYLIKPKQQGNAADSAQTQEAKGDETLREQAQAGTEGNADRKDNADKEGGSGKEDNADKEDDAADIKIADTIKPVIEGAQDITVYVGDAVAYRKNIIVTDDSGEASLEVDSGNADLSTPGDYPIRYVARDKAGNEAVAEVMLHVQEQPKNSEAAVSAIADQIISQVVTDQMTLYEKAYALWKWCGTSIAYSYSPGDTSSVWAGAYEGLVQRKGDCYVFYASYAVLLTRCGIENLCVARVGGKTSHWWNLVNTGSGWYHCDASPRAREHPYLCFMQTDAQVQAYTESYPEKPNYYTFDPSLYPERATEIIFEGRAGQQ